MGKRGPPPKPTALKKREGTYRKDRAARDEVVAPTGAPECPAYLDKIARDEWERIVPQLLELGGLAQIDGAALEGYCANYAQAVKFQKDADKRAMIKTPFGPKPNPAAGEARKAWALARQFAAEFGLTPAARSRVSKSEKPKGQAPPADRTPIIGPGLRVVNGGAGGGSAGG